MRQIEDIGLDDARLVPRIAARQCGNIGIDFHRPEKSLKLKMAWDMLHKLNFGVFGQLIIIPLLQKHRILAQVAGYHTEVIKFLPPITITRQDIEPRDYGLAVCAPGELAGGAAAANLAALLDVFAGRDRGAHLAALTLQSGLALFIAGRAISPQAGIALARHAVDSGNAERWLARLQRFAAEEQ